MMSIETGVDGSPACGREIVCDRDATASIYHAFVRKFHIGTCSEATLAP